MTAMHWTEPSVWSAMFLYYMFVSFVRQRNQLIRMFGLFHLRISVVIREIYY